MPVSDTEFAELKTRVSRLERAGINNTGTIGWVAGTLGTMQAVQDNHTLRLTLRLDRIETDVIEMKSDIRGLKADIAGLRGDLPGIVADAMREVLANT